MIPAAATSSGARIARRFVVLATLATSPAACRVETTPPVTAVRHLGPGELAAELVRLYAGRVEGAEFSVTGEYEGSIAALAGIERGDAEVTFAAAGATYEAFTSGTSLLPRPHDNLSGMAVVRTAALHLVIGPGIEFETLADLADTPVGIGPEWSNSAASARTILPLFGIPDIGLVPTPFDEIAEKLRDGTIGASFTVLPYPSQTVESVLAVEGTRIVPISEADRSVMREADLFLKPVVIPAGIYGGHPAIDVLGTDRVLVVRSDLPDDIVFGMLAVFFDAMPELSRIQPTLSGMRHDRAAATPIPLHAGAARYYRERQLFR